MCYRSFVAAMLLIFGLVGCTRTVTIRVVDARTGRPLAGVAAEYRLRTYDIALPFLNRREDRTYGPSGPDGLIVLKSLDRSVTSEVTFIRPGYQPAHASYVPEEDSFAWSSPNTFVSSKAPGWDRSRHNPLRSGETKPAKGAIVEVPLFPIGSTSTAPAAR